MKYVVSKFNDDGSIYPVYECEDEEEAMKTAYACNGVYEKVSPSLTADQQTVLGWLKEEHDRSPNTLRGLNRIHMGTLTPIGDETTVDCWGRLTYQQQFQVLAAFANYGLEGEG